MLRNFVKRLQRALLATMLCCGSAEVWAVTEVNVETAGTLSSLLTTTETSLKLTGSINGTDVKYLRQLIADGKVTSLDLSEIKIVSGGVAYYETNKTTKDVIGEYMFKDCRKLRSVVLPTSVTTIARSAFANTGLRKVEIPDKVTRLGYGAFSDNSSLTTVVIGSKMSHIEQGAFYNSGVTTVQAKPLTPPTLDAYIFTSRPTIRVFTDVLADYKESSWGQYGTIVGKLESYFQMEDDGSSIVNNLRDIYFQDAACTQLKAEYQAMTDEELTAAMTEGGMPEFMTTIALKLKNDQWAAYEKDFRIHSYNAYSDARYWNELLRSTGGSYMGNPTGIYSKGGDQIYVFVDEDVPADATLYIAGCGGKDVLSNAKSGKKLSKGLNVLDGQKDALYYILYIADTKSKTKTLQEWPAMKIHIEGGTVNGYYDVSRHSDADYQALLKAATHGCFTVRGGQSLFNFKTATYKKIWPSSIDKSICWYDSLTVWEKELMGICESVATGKRAAPPFCLTGGESIFPLYYNNPNFAIQGEETDGGWANSAWFRTSYNSEGCISSSFNVTRADLDDWCVAHESGHNNQGAITLEGGTEVSNNLFSNVIRYLDGLVTSNGSPLSVIMQEHARHEPFFTRSLDSQMRMYYQLYLYYHQAQKNTSFFPELFRELRRDPLGSHYSNTNETSLKFVRKVCELVQEDLTDFFTAWGFFEPFTNLTINDYGEHTMTVKQTDINRTLKEIAKYPKKNRTILFIEDRADYVLTTDFLTTAGKKRRNSELVGQCGKLGQFTSYLPDACEPSEYTYLQADSMYAMIGTGGVGFLVLDAEGKMITASNALSFSVPTSVGDNFTIYSIDADGTLHETSKAGEGAEVVNLTKAGTLADSLSANAIKATISGVVNGTDIKYLRQLTNEGNLMVLDLTDAKVTSGGQAYYESYRTSLNTLNRYAFYQCANLISICLPQTITSIEDHAFTKSGLHELRIPDAVTSVGVESYGDCKQLSMVVIGSKVKTMGQGVFYNSGVRDVYVKPRTPPTIGPYLFNSKPVIHVYARSLATYQASDWAQYGTLVGDLDDYADLVSIESIPAFTPEDLSHSEETERGLFDLQGRRLKAVPQKGIYIRNGKKYLIK